MTIKDSIEKFRSTYSSWSNIDKANFKALEEVIDNINDKVGELINKAEDTRKHANLLSNFETNESSPVVELKIHKKTFSEITEEEIRNESGRLEDLEHKLTEKKKNIIEKNLDHLEKLDKDIETGFTLSKFSKKNIFSEEQKEDLDALRTKISNYRDSVSDNSSASGKAAENLSETMKNHGNAIEKAREIEWEDTELGKRTSTETKELLNKFFSGKRVSLGDVDSENLKELKNLDEINKNIHLDYEG